MSLISVLAVTRMRASRRFCPRSSDISQTDRVSPLRRRRSIDDRGARAISGTGVIDDPVIAGNPCLLANLIDVVATESSSNLSVAIRIGL